ncbi:MAG: ABC transporter ATP-binding protein [Proteobacteria bacterium]|nr:ABC transporter ATP-binding protein [Pseudomonadota bacterium]
MSGGGEGALLSVGGLAKRFGGLAALDGVSFELGAGEMVALIGPNGAGKTTCFNLLNGQLRADAGSARLKGRELLGLAPHAIWRLGVGRTFQIPATFASMSVRENLQVALLSRARRLGALVAPAGEAFRDQADALLARVGLLAEAGRNCGVLSHGDLKRVELAVALVGEPELLLMDEPTAGAAPGERFRLMELVEVIVAERAIGVLFTEHDMDVVFGHARRVLVLDRGRLIAEGAPEAVRADPRVRAIYLGAAAGRG